MKSLFIYSSILILSILGFASCKKEVQIPSNKVEQKDSTATNMIKLNALMADVEAKEIKAYIESSDIAWQYDSLGFWYEIVKQGNNRQILKDAVVLVDYSVNTLQGDSCYSYKADKSRTIVVERPGYEKGLSLGLMKMHEGDSALLVIPSQLAYGMLGDRKAIPPRAVLIYHISSVRLK